MEKLVVGYSLKKEGVYLLVSIFMWLIVGLIAIIFIIILSTIRFSLNRFKATNVDNMNIALDKVQYDYDISISFWFLNIIPYFKFRINKDKMQKIKFKPNFKDINLYSLKKNYFRIKDDLHKIDLKLDKLYLKLYIRTEEIIFTNMLIVLISSILPITLAKIINKFDAKKYQYEIKPLYKNINLFNLKLNLVISLKVWDIIHLLFSILKKNYSKLYSYEFQISY